MWYTSVSKCPWLNTRTGNGPFPEPLPRWDVESERLATMWATEHESRADVIDRYRRVCEHSDATIDALALDAPGHVEWWPDPEVTLFDVLVHMIAETSRHAGHADILREGIDGVGSLRRVLHAQFASSLQRNIDLPVVQLQGAR